MSKIEELEGHIIIDIKEHMQKVAELQEKVKDLEQEIYYKNCQIKELKYDYKNASDLEKLMTKEHQYCLDNWRKCEQQYDQQIKNLMKDLKTLLVFGSKLISQDDRLFMASDYNMLLNIYNNYLRIFGLSNIDIFNDVLIDLKKKYEEFNTLKHV